MHGNRRIISDLQEVTGVLEPLLAEVSHIRARAQGSLDALKQRAQVDLTKIAAIGFCFGGTMALELACSGANIAGVVGFHSGLSIVAPQDAKTIKGKVSVHIGADDPSIPLEQRIMFEREMRAGKVDWQMDVYGGVVHSFTDPDADKAGRPEQRRYDAKADARSWREMRILLEEIFGHK